MLYSRASLAQRGLLMRNLLFCLVIAGFSALPLAQASAETGAVPPKLSAEDLFALQWVTDVQISPDGDQVVYVRSVNDIMHDRTRRNIWMIGADGGEHQPLVSGTESATSPRFSPDGRRLAYLAKAGEKTQLFVRWLASGETALISNLTQAPSHLAWSPDGKSIAFVMRVLAEKPALAKAPKKPDGAEWAPAMKVIDAVTYRFDGRGYIKPGFDHVFVVPADGGSARQLTQGDFDHHGPLAWTPDGERLLFSSLRDEDWQYQRLHRDLYAVHLANGELTQMTDRPGMIGSPTVSPDGETIAVVYEDHQGRQYSESSLALLDVDGGNFRRLGVDLDRSMSDPKWSADSRRLYFHFDDQGERIVATIDSDGRVRKVVKGLSGTTIGRPYVSGGYAVARDGTVAYSAGTAQRPADLHVATRRGSRQLTDLNANLLDHRSMAQVEEIRYASSVDGAEIQGWYLTPPGFDPGQRYPLILEIHGGPHLAYGPHFSAELQRYAAAGYVVFYNNHRGSSSYGTDFGMLLEYKYSSKDDFGDHMSGIDAMIAKGFIDPDRLYVTGGSAGGIAAAYAIGLTDRFKAAAITKPVINWISKTLTGDTYTSQIARQFPGLPWEEFEHYWQRSPLSLVGNVTTPALLMTGENDFRTPMSETEQYYQALKLRRVDTVMVRVPGTSHSIASTPSRMIAKIDNTLAWFARYGGEPVGKDPAP
ncbi:MAG: S9 family peptidase [Pseudomonadota bacterium]